MATLLTSLHHVQRLLRRLPVGHSSTVLHLNELPSNVQEKLPVVLQQHQRRLRAPTEPRTGDDDYARLITMRPPALTASDTALFALFRTAQKERRAQRRRHQEQQQKRGATCSSPSDPLGYLCGLEEACLLLPDTRESFVSLGIATGAHDRALSPPPTSAMDAVHVSLASRCTDRRVDYAAVPHYYVLGLPTRLLAEHGDSRHGAVDLSRWLVVDMATGQLLLRRRPRDRTTPASEAVDAAAAAAGRYATSEAADLDTEVFLAQTYNFDPRRAYAAALQAAAASRGVPPLYTLFYLQLARGQATVAAGVSPENAGTTYPASFMSYTTEVCTTRELAVRAAASKSTTAADGGSSVGLADATPLFMSLAGKRLRFGTAAPPSSASPPRAGPSGEGEPHLWTAQIVRRQHGIHPPQPRFPNTEAHAAGTERSAAADAGRQREATAQSSLHAAVELSFHDWQAMVAATGAADVGSTTVETGAKPHTSSMAAAEAAATSHTRTAADADVAERTGHRHPDAAAAACEAPSLLERQLDAEAAPGSREWQRGLRLRRVPIAVARPLLPQCPAALRASELRPQPPVDASVHAPSQWTSACGGRVSEAPLAAALWEALYRGPAPPLSAVDRAGSFAAHRGVDVLPLGIDRLAQARERVLVPFLVHQPRRVLPERLAPSLLHDSATPPHLQMASTGEGGAARPLQGQHRGLSAAAEEAVCPLLWRLEEVERLCGWHRHATVFERVFGTFAGLLVREMYVTVGQHSPAVPMSATVPTAHPDPPASPPQSPLLLFADVAYVLRVLHPALWAFAGQTCTLLASGLCVYRSLLGADRASAAARAEGTAEAADVALAVAVHHRQLRTWLRRLQAVAPAELRAWLAAAHSCSTVTLKAAVAVAEVSAVPASCLPFFAGAVQTGSFEAACGEAGTAAALSEGELSRAVDRLLALTPSCIRVVPLVDFVVWGATASNFSDASVRCHAAEAAKCRAAMDETADGVALVRYCMRFPRQLCCESADGRTVAVLRPGGR